METAIRGPVRKRIIAGVCLTAVLTWGAGTSVAFAQSAQKVLPADEVLRQWIEEVWHGGKLELVPSLVNSTYIRHGASGTRTVTPEQYALEIAALRQRFPDLRFTLHDRVIQNNMIWSRWSWRGTEATTGKAVTRSAIQIYRLESGKLAETWAASLPDGVGW